MHKRIQQVVGHRLFQAATIGAIFAAGALAGMETSAKLVAQHGPLLVTLDRLVLAFFTVEIALKILAHGSRPGDFFRNGWNTFDFVIVAICFLPLQSHFAAVLRLARTLRILRLASALPKLQLLVGALLRSLSSMGYVTLLLCLVFYIYGVLGVHIFREADPVNFGSLPAALLSLFRLITLDNWTDLYHVASQAGPLLAAVYFVSFILLGTMIMLNLFIGIVMNSMSETHEELNTALEVPAFEAGAPVELAAHLDRIEADLRSVQTQLGSLRRLSRLTASASDRPASLPRAQVALHD